MRDLVQNPDPTVRVPDIVGHDAPLVIADGVVTRVINLDRHAVTVESGSLRRGPWRPTTV